MEKQKLGWLRRIRKNKGYKTQKDISDILGMSPQHYSNIENGNRIASGEDALKISIVLGVPYERFFESRILEWRQEWEARNNADKSRPVQ